MLPGLRSECIRDLRAVRNRRVAVVDQQRDIERRFVCGLVKRGECASRVGRFHLADRVATAVRLAQIKPAQLVIENSGVRDLDRGAAFRQRARHGKRRHLVLFVERHACGLHAAACRDRHLAKLNLRGVQRHGGRRVLHIHLDRFATAERGVLQVGREPERVPRRDHVARQPLRGGRSGQGKQSCQDDHDLPHGSKLPELGTRESRLGIGIAV